jgi:hypothetical protein
LAVGAGNFSNGGKAGVFRPGAIESAASVAVEAEELRPGCGTNFLDGLDGALFEDGEGLIAETLA